MIAVEPLRLEMMAMKSATEALRLEVKDTRNEMDSMEKRIRTDMASMESRLMAAIGRRGPTDQ